MSINDLQTVAETLLDLTIEVTPKLEAIEGLKDILRDATTKADDAMRFVSPHGLVETRRGTLAVLRGEKPVVNEAVFASLPAAKQAELIELGVISLQEDWSRAAKPAITVKPVFPKKAAA